LPLNKSIIKSTLKISVDKALAANFQEESFYQTPNSSPIIENDTPVIEGHSR
jgi:hypothetical protein